MYIFCFKLTFRVIINYKVFIFLIYNLTTKYSISLQNTAFFYNESINIAKRKTIRIAHLLLRSKRCACSIAHFSRYVFHVFEVFIVLTANGMFSTRSWTHKKSLFISNVKRHWVVKLMWSGRRIRIRWIQLFTVHCFQLEKSDMSDSWN